ncbi:MAG: histidine kinase dimerization/phosphoacceptor domain-containing protein, partial [Bacteroidota bacterium]
MLQGLQPTTILIIVASILLALLVGAFLLSFLYFNKKALSYEGEIEQVKTAAETAVVKAHINGVEEERKRIGGDIHDDIGPMLAVARMSLYGFRHCHTPEEVRQHIDKVEGEINEVSEKIRAISKEA